MFSAVVMLGVSQVSVSSFVVAVVGTFVPALAFVYLVDRLGWIQWRRATEEALGRMSSIALAAVLFWGVIRILVEMSDSVAGASFVLALLVGVVIGTLPRSGIDRVS